MRVFARLKAWLDAPPSDWPNGEARFHGLWADSAEGWRSPHSETPESLRELERRLRELVDGEEAA